MILLRFLETPKPHKSMMSGFVDPRGTLNYGFYFFTKLNYSKKLRKYRNVSRTYYVCKPGSLFFDNFGGSLCTEPFDILESEHLKC